MINLNNNEIENLSFIKPQKLYTLIVEQFIELIKNGDVKPGQKLPPERELAQKLDVSRASLREALIALKMMGVVEIKPNNGTYITHKTVPPILKELTYLNLGDSPFEILQARIAIEPNIAAIAASAHDEDSIGKIEKILSSIEHKLMVHELDGFFMNAKDCEFHLTVAKATQNSVLIGVGYLINKLMKQELWTNLLNDTLNSTDQGQQKGIFEHKEILSAIHSGDSRAAYSTMRAHLLRVYKIVKEIGLFSPEDYLDVTSDGVIDWKKT
jgi:GntR family transcriptional repressor for pyruvate dehydrogenase complex